MCVIYVRGKMMITDVNEWLAQTPQKIVRLEAKCADGFRMSIQASQAHYCSPRINKCQNYETVEIGFRTNHQHFFLLMLKTLEIPQALYMDMYLLG